MLVLIRKDRLSLGYRPRDAQLRISPEQSRVILRRIVVRSLVDDFRIRLKRSESVGESLRSQDLVPLVGAHGSGHMLPEGRRRPPEIHRDIEQGTSHHPQQFILGERLRLVMKPSSYTLFRRE